MSCKWHEGCNNQGLGTNARNLCGIHYYEYQLIEKECKECTLCDGKGYYKLDEMMHAPHSYATCESCRTKRGHS